jgi:hypothetical protein
MPTEIMHNQRDMNHPEARAHHFLPQCWLSGFTDSGQNEGQLWVTDLKRRKQWKSNPVNSGHRRDFYRLSDERLNPTAVESKFAEMETLIAPILRIVEAERRMPHGDELQSLLVFMAIQWVRVPAFRTTIGPIADSIYRSFMSELLRSPESWAAALKKAGYSKDAPGADYDKILEVERSGEYSFSADTPWFLKNGLKAAESIIPCLETRYWGALISESGQFIGSDSPVALEASKDHKVGFKNAPFVTYPVGRHVLLYGTIVRVPQPPLTTKLIAQHNTFAMLTAQEQVYSHRPDFHWLGANGKCQNDWTLFAKEDFG